MNLTTQIAKHFRDVYFGDNWTDVNLKDTIADVTWQEATTQVHGLNTIVRLVSHMNYYVNRQIKVLEGEPLEGSDKLSFDHPPILSQKDWESFLDKIWAEAETFAKLIEQMPESQLWADFWNNKYGNYYRNIHGVIEHNHYHLGQIVLIKKILRQTDHAEK